MKRSIFILFTLCLFVSVPLAMAQVGSLTAGDINVSMIPEEPGPNQNVSISIVSYSTDLNAANISWSVNGKVIQSGIGQKSFSFTTGSLGATTIVDIKVVTNNGQTVVNTLSITPSMVDIIWQSESYVPPFYKGKALESFQNKITFIAVPHIIGGSGVEINPKNLIYKWTKDGSVQDSASGYGKNTFTFSPSVIARPMNISVNVSTTDSNATGFATIDVAPGDPLVLLYEKNPEYGIQFQKALIGTEQMNNQQEISVIAEPFFFGTVNQHQFLTYDWEINGAKIDSDPSQTTRVFRQVEGVSGTANISVSVGHVSKILQLVKNNFNLEFGNTTTANPTF